MRRNKVRWAFETDMDIKRALKVQDCIWGGWNSSNLLPLWAGIRRRLLWSTIQLFSTLLRPGFSCDILCGNFRLSSPRPGDLPATKRCEFAQCLYDKLIRCNTMTWHWHDYIALYTIQLQKVKYHQATNQNLLPQTANDKKWQGKTKRLVTSDFPATANRHLLTRLPKLLRDAGHFLGVEIPINCHQISSQIHVTGKYL